MKFFFYLISFVVVWMSSFVDIAYGWMPRDLTPSFAQMVGSTSSSQG